LFEMLRVIAWSTAGGGIDLHRLAIVA